MKLASVLILLVAIIGACAAQGTSPAAELKRVHEFLLKDSHRDQDADARYSVAFVDLNRDGKNEALVYYVGSSYCGSGGCQLLVLTPSGNSYRTVTATTVTQLPIRVLDTESNGWRDLSVAVSGGGLQPGYEARLRFNGRKYPNNPTVPPARKLADPKGKIVIDDKSEKFPMYPAK